MIFSAVVSLTDIFLDSKTSLKIILNEVTNCWI